MTKQMTVELEGMSPLMQSRFVVKESSGANTKPKNLSLEDEVRERMYATKDGQPYVPGEHVKASIQSVASAFKVVGQGKKTFKSTIPGGLLVSGINLITGKYEVDQRPVVVNGGRIVRVRPRWDEWKVQVNLTLLDEDLNPDLLMDMLSVAGLKAGIGDARNLGCGRYRAELVKVREL